MDPADGDLKPTAGQHDPASREDPPTAAPTHAERPGAQAPDLTHQPVNSRLRPGPSHSTVSDAGT